MTELATQDPDLDTDWTWRTLVAVTSTAMVPKAFQGKPHEAFAAIQIGREAGLGPMTSLQMIDVISGKPSMSAELMVSLVRQAGHSLTATTLTPKLCTAQGVRADNGDKMEYSFSMEDAAAAGLKGGAWTTYPASMLWARASSQLIRILFPDCLISFHNYDPEELQPPHQDSVAPDINSLPTVEQASQPVPAIEGATDALELEPGTAYREEEDPTRPFE